MNVKCILFKRDTDNLNSIEYKNKSTKRWHKYFQRISLLFFIHGMDVRMGDNIFGNLR